MTYDLRLIVHWLQANKIFSIIDKTEIVLFCISGQKITPTTHTRSIGNLMDQQLSWDQHLKMLKQKLGRADGLLTKVCYY